MPTDELKQFINKRGPYAFLFSFVAAIMALAQLSPEHINTLQRLWPLLGTPAGLLLMSTPLLAVAKFVFLDKIASTLKGWVDAYLEEQRNRTRVEGQIYERLDELTNQFERMLETLLDNRQFFQQEIRGFYEKFSEVDKKLSLIYRNIEKRENLTYPKDF